MAGGKGDKEVKRAGTGWGLLSSPGCTWLSLLGGAGALALAGLSGPAWTGVPLDVEVLQPGWVATAPKPVVTRAYIENLLTRHSNLSRDTRFRVARAVVEEARMADLNPLLVMAVIGVESQSQEDAVSSRGAQGLMQLRARTAQFVDERERIGIPEDVNATIDPALNVRLGVRYLHHLVAAFGDLNLALVAYNAGPHRLSGYLEDGEPIPDRWRAYSRRVQGDYRKLQSEALGRRGLPVETREKVAAR